MLKKIKDNNGSALIIAILTMFVIFIFVMSFIGNVTASTKIDSNAIDSDQAYLIAKSGMRLFENEYSDADLESYIGHKIKGKINDSDNEWFEIEVVRPAGQPINVICTGHHNGAAYKLYKYSKVVETSTETTTITVTTKKASPVDKSANKQFNDNLNQFNTAVVGGPTSYLGSGDITLQNSSSYLTGAIVSVGNISLTSGGGIFSDIFTKGTLSIGHGKEIYGEVYAKAINTPGLGSGAKLQGSVYVTDYIVLNDNDGWILGGSDPTQSTVIKIAGKNDYNGYALFVNCTGSGATLNKDVIVNGNAYLKNVTIGGDLYVNGDVFIGSGVNVGGTIYYTGNCNQSGGNIQSVTVSEFENMCGSGDTIYNEINTKIEENVPVSQRPVTYCPATVSTNVYSSIDELPKYNDNGKTVYVINDSCTINFSLEEALCGNNGVNQNRILMVNADDKKIDVLFANDFKFGYNGWGGKIQVFDHNHTGLIRFFFAQGIDVSIGPVAVANGNKWPIEPVNGVGKVDADYVPNLYYFSMDTTVRDITFLTSQAVDSMVCIPGYWLTPYYKVSTANTGKFDGDADTKVEFTNAPFVHGMLTTDTAAFGGGSGKVAIKYYDPDWDHRNKWSYADAISDVYMAP